MPKASKKQRTISHVNEDLSKNHVEYLALENRFAIEDVRKDYGFDLTISTFSSRMEAENGAMCAQLKARAKVKPVTKAGKKYISYPIAKSDLNLWLYEAYPVIFIVYDVKGKKAYWLYVQKYFNDLVGFDINKVKKQKSVNIPIRNILTKAVFKDFRKTKNMIHKKFEKLNVHA